MKLKEIVKGKEYPFIECRCLYKTAENKICDMFYGACSYEDGKLKPLDADSYSLEDEYKEWEEFTNKEGVICLTVWENVDLEKKDKTKFKPT